MTASFSASNLTASTAFQGQATAKALRESIYLCTKRVLGAKEAAYVKNKGCGERSHIPCFINERLRRIRPLGLALENSDGFLQLQIVIVVTRNGIGSQFIGQFHDDIRFQADSMPIAPLRRSRRGWWSNRRRNRPH